MNAPSLLPTPSAGDSFAVKHALEVARSLWDCGEHRQAVVWVRRAVEAADQAGDTSRVAMLARAVADLGTPSTMPPPPPTRSTVPPPARSTVPPPLPSRAQAKPRLLPPPPASAPPPPPQPRVLESGPAPVAAPVSEARRRVSVKVSVRDPDLLVVRPLADGEAAPAGTKEAFLVMVDR